MADRAFEFGETQPVAGGFAPPMPAAMDEADAPDEQDDNDDDDFDLEDQADDEEEQGGEAPALAGGGEQQQQAAIDETMEGDEGMEGDGGDGGMEEEQGMEVEGGDDAAQQGNDDDHEEEGQHINVYADIFGDADEKPDDEEDAPAHEPPDQQPRQDQEYQDEMPGVEEGGEPSPDDIDEEEGRHKKKKKKKERKKPERKRKAKAQSEDDPLKAAAEGSDYGGESSPRSEKEVTKEDRKIEEWKKQRKSKRKAADINRADASGFAYDRIRDMEEAHQADLNSIEAGRPATAKVDNVDLMMNIISMAKWRDYFIGEHGGKLCSALASWLSIHNNLLPNVHVRGRILETLISLPLSPDVLSQSYPRLGEVIIDLWKHKDVGREHKSMIERLVKKWARSVMHERDSLDRREDDAPSPVVARPVERVDRQHTGDLGDDEERFNKRRHARIPQAPSFHFKVKPEGDKNVEVPQVDPKSREGRIRRRVMEIRRGPGRRNLKAQNPD
ncbi:unnamed protein product [Vitrella brassicaformis CCMP3155]|uniref:TFIIS N-terminal domain-containing protein n=2 Tax=Vitrella brassicaformis TaxID=1169539 RepID=A0A0G4EII7_VITBC|nr:unnamed protein product [Vitrella brassicaformis CCMP3155]|mmetsp:Transcript_30569/g.75887  ORF Transcript_30569/g.75887 Transcript_30569/m.75887 type:complete len:500 (+) Transcript_30569:69-1568(+)|eukprot:CEL95697.1 unnamed protein product [Vitrella brassicaformis CCMP3155]